MPSHYCQVGMKVQVPYLASFGVEGCLIPAGAWSSRLLIKTQLVPLWLVSEGHLTSLLLSLWWGWKSRLIAWPLRVGVGSYILCVVSEWPVFLYCPFPGPLTRESMLFLSEPISIARFAGFSRTQSRIYEAKKKTQETHHWVFSLKIPR